MRNTILLVDDTKEVLELFEDILKTGGYDVIRSTSGEQALEILETQTPDLILLDVFMPKMDGYQFCERIKSNSKTQHIPIIFVSALNQTFDKIKAFKLGAADYIEKPINNTELLMHIETQLKVYKYQKKLKRTIKKLEKEKFRTSKLKEREKELNGLYKLLILFEKKNISMNQVFQGVVDLIPDACWQVFHLNEMSN
jgi:two-component system sensor histidine kinase/response regulator